MKFRERISVLMNKVIFVLSGDFITSKRLDRFMGFTVYLFALACTFIAWSLLVEKSLAKVQEHEKEITDLKINYEQKYLDLSGMDNRTVVDRMLKNCHSTLHAPVKPPARLEIER